MASYAPTPEESQAYKYLFEVATKGSMSSIGGSDAVKFFVASGLPVPVLKQVWAIASNGQKEMGPREFSTAMRLIALAQAGYPVDETTLQKTEAVSCNSPKFQGIEQPSQPSTPSTPHVPTPSPSVPTAAVASPMSWAIPPEQRSGYEKLWNGQPKNAQGLLEGKDAAAFFAKSGQSREVLRTVWQLSDVGGDGMMDLTEFLIGMHLTMMAKKGAPLPSTLPADLQRSAAAPFERSASNTSQLSASMMQMMQPTTTSTTSSSMLNESEANLSRAVPAAKQPSQREMAPMGGDDYDGMKSDAMAMNSTLMTATSRLDEARGTVKSQIQRTSSDISYMRSERERLMAALTEANAAFQADADKLRALDEELNQLREEVARLRQGVDAKRAAVGAQQEIIGARLNETRTLSKQMVGLAAGSDAMAGQKRRQPPGPPTSGSADFFQDSGFPSGDAAAAHHPAPGGNAFDAFEDPYAGQGSGGKSNEY